MVTQLLVVVETSDKGKALLSLWAFVMGRPFITACTSHTRVSNPSSFGTCSLKRAFRILRVVLIRLSQYHRGASLLGGVCVWGGGGGVKNQRTYFRNKYSPIRCLFHFLIQVRIFFSPLMKLAPPSRPHQHSLASSPDEMAFIKESVSSECAISRCTALIVRRVKMQPCLFT